MPSVEFWSTRGRERVFNLEDSSYMIGSDPASTIVLDDPTVSALHAALDRVGSKWLIRDLGARNRTKLNGDELTFQHQLRDGDEISIGRARLVYHETISTPRPVTERLHAAPTNITNGERKVLIELCRPLLSHTTFHTPASVREIAARLNVGKGAIQAHLVSLYDKFEIYEFAQERRIDLANAAIERGAVTRGDIERSTRDENDDG